MKQIAVFITILLTCLSNLKADTLYFSCGDSVVISWDSKTGKTDTVWKYFSKGDSVFISWNSLNDRMESNWKSEFGEKTYLSVSPDGKYIGFNKVEPEIPHARFYTGYYDVKEKTLITINEGSNDVPAFSPNSKLIAFVDSLYADSKRKTNNCIISFYDRITSSFSYDTISVMQVQFSSEIDWKNDSTLSLPACLPHTLGFSPEGATIFHKVHSKTGDKVINNINSNFKNVIKKKYIDSLAFVLCPDYYLQDPEAPINNLVFIEKNKNTACILPKSFWVGNMVVSNEAVYMDDVHREPYGYNTDTLAIYDIGSAKLSIIKRPGSLIGIIK